MAESVSAAWQKIPTWCWSQNHGDRLLWYYGAHEILMPHFIKRKSGHFVTINERMGIIGTRLPYRLRNAKHALQGFSDRFWAELWHESKNIHVTLVCPGWIHTNISVNALVGDGSKTKRWMKQRVQVWTAMVCQKKKWLRPLKHAREEVYIGGAKEVMAIRMKRFFPWFFSKIVRNAKVR